MIRPPSCLLAGGLTPAPVPQDGGAAFVRDLHRLGGGRDVVFHSHLLGHAACYRPGLGFMTRRFAEYFEPWAEDAADFEGTGSYSWYQGACGHSPRPALARARARGPRLAAARAQLE